MYVAIKWSLLRDAAYKITEILRCWCDFWWQGGVEQFWAIMGATGVCAYLRIAWKHTKRFARKCLPQRFRPSNVDLLKKKFGPDNIYCSASGDVGSVIWAKPRNAGNLLDVPRNYAPVPQLCWNAHYANMDGEVWGKTNLVKHIRCDVTPSFEWLLSAGDDDDGGTDVVPTTPGGIPIFEDSDDDGVVHPRKKRKYIGRSRALDGLNIPNIPY